MVQQLITVFIGNCVLQALDFFTHEFNNVTRINAHHMVVMVTIIEFKNGMSTLEVMPRNETGSLELRKNP